MNAITTIQNQIYALKHDFQAVLVDRSLNFEREAGFAVQTITGNSYATGIAKSNPQSVVNAVTNIAAIGISLNPAKKQAYLVPRDGKICLDISYMGLIDLAMNTGSIKWAQAALVHEQDVFSLNGYDKPPTHTFSPFSKSRGAIVGVYVVVKTADGEYLTHTMEIGAVHAIRDRSAAWKAWIKDKKSCPWVTDEGEMVKKTCVKQAYKYWPKTERLEKAIHYLNTDGDEGLASLAQPQSFGDDLLSGLINRVNSAESEEALRAVWTEGVAQIRAAKDRRAYDQLKAAVSTRSAAIKAAEPPIEGERTEESEQ